MLNILILSNDDMLNKRLNKAFNEFVSHLISFKITNINDVYDDASNADLLLVNPKMDNLNLRKLSKRCAYAWFTEDAELQSVHTAYVYLYQSIFEISQALMRIIEGFQQGDICKADFFQNTKVISFFSCGGKTGATSIAESFTYNKVYNEKKAVLYIMLSPMGSIQNLQTYADSDVYLEDVDSNLDIISFKDIEVINGFKSLEYSLKFDSKRLEEIVKRTKKCEYDYIVIDGNLNYVNVVEEVLKQSNDILLITDGSKESIESLEKINDFTFQIDFKINQKIKVRHNKYQSNLKVNNSIYSEKLLCTVESIDNYNGIADIVKQISSIDL